MNEEQTRALGLLNNQSLLLEWEARLQLRAEGGKLWAEGGKLYAEGCKLHAEGSKLRAEGDKLWADGDKLWAEAVIGRFGPKSTIEWTGGGCRLGNGEVYRDTD